MSLPKVADVEKESLYGYVFGVSGPGETIWHSSRVNNILYSDCMVLCVCVCVCVCLNIKDGNALLLAMMPSCSFGTVSLSVHVHMCVCVFEY